MTAVLDDNAVQHRVPHRHPTHADVPSGWLRAAELPGTAVET